MHDTRDEKDLTRIVINHQCIKLDFEPKNCHLDIEFCKTNLFQDCITTQRRAKSLNS